jgi:putative membrane protein
MLSLKNIILTAGAHSDDGDFFMHHMFDDSNLTIMNGIFMILFWAVIIIGFVYLVNNYLRPQNNKKEEKTALNILQERYAKGEIGKEEFEEKKKDLSL